MHMKMLFGNGWIEAKKENVEIKPVGQETYKAWLVSLGLIFTQESTNKIKLTLAGEAIMNGNSPVEVLTTKY